MNDAAGLERMKALGTRKVPLLALGDRYVFAENMEKVAEFVGLGSTAVACARYDVGFIGADIDETYLAEAVERTWTAVHDRAAADKRPAKARRGELKAGKATAS